MQKYFYIYTSCSTKRATPFSMQSYLHLFFSGCYHFCQTYNTDYFPTLYRKLNYLKKHVYYEFMSKVILYNKENKMELAYTTYILSLALSVDRYIPKCDANKKRCSDS